MTITGELLVGGQLKLKPTPYDGGNHPLTGRRFAFVSSAPSVATVDANGVVTGVAIGVATITATAEGKGASTTVRVVPLISAVVASRVAITPTGSATSLPAGQTLQLAAMPIDANGNPLSNAGLTWASSNPAIATVNAATGLVTAVAIGTAVITAAVAGLQQTLTVSVTQALDGSLADVRAVIPDSAQEAIWIGADSVVTLDGGGFTSQVADARGAQYGAPLIGRKVGGNAPTFDGVNKKFIFDGVQNYLSTSASVRWSPGQDVTKVYWYIGTAPPAGSFPFIVADAALSEYMGFHADGSLAGYIDLSTGGAPTAGPSGVDGARAEVLDLDSATPKLYLMASHARENKTGPTANANALSFRFPGRLRHLRTEAGFNTALNANMQVCFGATPANTQYTPSQFYAGGVLNEVPTLAWIQALERLATRIGGATAVRTAPPRGVICVGDSITRGFGASDLTKAYPYVLQTLLGNGYEVNNVGHNGRELIEMLATNGFLHQALGDADPLRASTWLVLFLGTNDIQVEGATAATLTPQEQAAADLALAQGYKVMLVAILKRSNFTGANEANAVAVNAAMAAMVGTHCTAFYNSRADVDPTNVADSPDGTHPNDAAYARLAAGVKAVILANGG